MTENAAASAQRLTYAAAVMLPALRRLCAAATLACLVPAVPASGQDRAAVLARYSYDPSIPTLERVVGHDHGEEITSPEQIVTYLRALAEAAPDRTRLVEYGRTWEGRPLLLLAIAAPAHIARIDQLKADYQRLADPRALSAADEAALTGELPVVVALVHSVHGNEISPAGAALLEAYHLLAARDDPRVDRIRAGAIVLIDPLQNPDGRARFVHQTRVGRGAEADAHPLAAEHDEPWPGGRANHYLFDLNRDWFAQTQPESRGRVAALREWMPHVVVDLHEMGANSSFFFPPSARPGNTHTTPVQYELLEVFGRANAEAFDAEGYPYFTREVFDAFYPGYGVSWPMAQGAIGMTFEKASARGLAHRRDDGTVLTYLDGIVEHFTAAVTTADTAAGARERLLREFVAFRRSAVAEGDAHAVKQYVLVPGRDPGRARRLAALLVANGIEVRQTTADATLDGTPVPAGSFVVPHGQPAGRLVRNLLDRETPMPADFIEAQEERRHNRQPDQIYDVTAWSLPLLYDVTCLTASRPIPADSRPWTPDPAIEGAPLAAARVGYLLPWGSTTVTVTATLLRQGVRVSVSGEPFTVNERRFPAGTAIVRTTGQQADVAAILGPLATRLGADVVAIDSAYVVDGLSLGSNQVRPLKAPRVVLAWDTPTQSLSAGWARYVLEQRLGLAPSAVRVSSLGRLPLADADVIVLPSGQYGTAIGADLLRRLQDWIEAGGTLVTLAEATRWATQPTVGLLATSAEWKGGAAVNAKPAEPRGSTPAQPIDFDAAIEPAQEPPTLVPGSILNTRVDTTHWLAAGIGESLPVNVQSQRVFTPLPLDRGRNVIVYAAPDALVASGIVWEESRAQLAHKAYLLHQPRGQGHVIGFAEDPNNRAFADATQLLFANAVLLGAAH